MVMSERSLLSQWEISGMGEDGCGCCCCCCEGEAGLDRQHTLIQLLRKKESRLRRTGVCFAVAAFLLIVLALGSLVAVALGARGLQTSTCQPVKTPENCPTEEPKDVKNPSAMLTVPYNRTTRAYLQWESKDGNAYCHGFTYFNGSLVVPRAGYYRVFLQITYENNTCKDDVNLSYTVFTKSDSYQDDRPFLKSEDTVSCRKKYWRKSLYTSGLKSLEANTKLFVTSLHPELIVPHEQQVFFGAELLPQ